MGFKSDDQRKAVMAIIQGGKKGKSVAGRKKMNRDPFAVADDNMARIQMLGNMAGADYWSDVFQELVPKEEDRKRAVYDSKKHEEFMGKAIRAWIDDHVAGEVNAYNAGELHRVEELEVEELVRSLKKQLVSDFGLKTAQQVLPAIPKLQKRKKTPMERANRRLQDRFRQEWEKNRQPNGLVVFKKPPKKPK